LDFYRKVENFSKSDKLLIENAEYTYEIPVTLLLREVNMQL